MTDLRFDGRVAEDFKLRTGTWVHVGALRVKLIAACDPIVQDAVITGQSSVCSAIAKVVNFQGLGHNVTDGHARGQG